MDAPLLEPAVIRRKSTSLLHESKLQKNLSTKRLECSNQNKENRSLWDFGFSGYFLFGTPLGRGVALSSSLIQSVFASKVWYIRGGRAQATQTKAAVLEQK